MNSLKRTAVVCTIGALGLCRPAAADVAWSGSSGTHSASAQFGFTSSRLLITLTNTSTADAQQKGDVLTAVFFNITSATLLTPVSAAVAPGSSVVFGNTDPGGVVGGEWGYKNHPIVGFSSGMSASHLNGFGPHTNFPGSNLSGGTNLGGIGYGLTTAGDNATTGTQDVTGKYALIRNSAVFALDGLPSDFDLNRIQAVQFWYGNTSFDTQLTGSVPAPGAAAALALGALAAGRRRSRAR